MWLLRTVYIETGSQICEASATKNGPKRFCLCMLILTVNQSLIIKQNFKLNFNILKLCLISTSNCLLKLKIRILWRLILLVCLVQMRLILILDLRNELYITKPVAWTRRKVTLIQIRGQRYLPVLLTSRIRDNACFYLFYDAVNRRKFTCFILYLINYQNFHNTVK